MTEGLERASVWVGVDSNGTPHVWAYGSSEKSCKARIDREYDTGSVVLIPRQFFLGSTESCGGVGSRHADNLLDGSDALAPVASAAKRIGEQPEAAHSQQTHRAGVAPGPHDTLSAGEKA